MGGWREEEREMKFYSIYNNRLDFQHLISCLNKSFFGVLFAIRFRENPRKMFVYIRLIFSVLNIWLVRFWQLDLLGAAGGGGGVLGAEFEFMRHDRNLSLFLSPPTHTARESLPAG